MGPRGMFHGESHGVPRHRMPNVPQWTSNVSHGTYHVQIGRPTSELDVRRELPIIISFQRKQAISRGENMCHNEQTARPLRA